MKIGGGGQERQKGTPGRKKLKAKGTHNAQGAESNLSFIQLANEAREPDADGGLMVGKNFSQQATLTQDFYSCLSLLLSVFLCIQEGSSPRGKKGN